MSVCWTVHLSLFLICPYKHINMVKRCISFPEYTPPAVAYWPLIDQYWSWILASDWSIQTQGPRPLTDNLSFSSAMWRRGREVATPTWQGTAFQETLGAWASDLRPSMRFTIFNTIFKWNAFMTTRSLRWDPGPHLPPSRRLWTAPEDRDLGSQQQV